MDTYRIIHDNDSNDDSMLIESSTRTKINNDYIRNFHQDGKPLRYPRNIHPFKIRRHIIAVIIITLVLLGLIGVSFSFKFWLHSEYKQFGFCGLFACQSALVLVYYAVSSLWLTQLSEFGYFRYPRRMRNLRTLVLIVWFLGLLLLSPMLVALRLMCPESNYNNSIVCMGRLNDVHLMQIYLGVETVVVAICLVIYLIKAYLFGRRRLWPDVWNEQLEGEGKLIDFCPLLQQAEVIPLEPNHQTFQNTLSQRILHTQAYLIRYLKHHNSVLSARLLKLSSENKELYNVIGNENNNNGTENVDNKVNNEENGVSNPMMIDSNATVFDSSSISSNIRRSSTQPPIGDDIDDRSSY